MDKRKYTFVGVQVSTSGEVDYHLSKNRYWFDLQNKKGLADYVVYESSEPQSAKDILQNAMNSEAVSELGLKVTNVLSQKLEKILNEESRIASKGTVKRGRKPKEVKSVDDETDSDDIDLEAIANEIVPSMEAV